MGADCSCGRDETEKKLASDLEKRMDSPESAKVWVDLYHNVAKLFEEKMGSGGGGVEFDKLFQEALKTQLRGIHEKLFALYDKDKSSTLDKTEYRRLVKDMYVALQKMVPALLEKTIDLAFAQAEKAVGAKAVAGYREMFRTQFSALSNILSAKLEETIARSDAIADKNFQKADTNNDNLLSKTEWMAVRADDEACNVQ